MKSIVELTFLLAIIGLLAAVSVSAQAENPGTGNMPDTPECHSDKALIG